MKNWICSFILIIGLSAAGVGQSAGLDSTFRCYFPGINVNDSLSGIVRSMLHDTARFEARDTTGASYYIRYRTYELVETNEADVFIDFGDTTIPFATPYIFVAVDFGSQEACEMYFNKVRADFSNHLVMKKIKPGKRPVLGKSVDYDFYDKTNKRLVSVSMSWPFDMDSNYGVIICVNK